MRSFLGALLALLVMSSICLASNTNSCTLVGTWYGGSPDAGFPYYHATFTPTTSATRVSGRFQYNSEVASFGYLNATDWTGDETLYGTNKFKGFIMSMYQWNPTSTLLPPGVDPALPEMDFIPYNIEFLDCNTFKGTIYHWYVYFNFTNDITPLSKNSRPPDVVMDFSPPIVEIYHRAPNGCPGCPFASTSGSTMAAPAWMGKGPLKR